MDSWRRRRRFNQRKLIRRSGRNMAKLETGKRVERRGRRLLDGDGGPDPKCYWRG